MPASALRPELSALPLPVPHLGRSCDARERSRAEQVVLASLMERVQTGDADAFAQLYDLTAFRVAQVVRRVLLASDHASEIVQEIYLHAWQHARLYDPARGSVLGWLSVIAHRRAVDRVRSTTSSRLRDHRSAITSDAVVPDVADLGIARVEATWLRAALLHLTPIQGDAVRLVYLQGYTYREAAAALGVPLGTVKSRVRDGVLALRSHLHAISHLTAA